MSITSEDLIFYKDGNKIYSGGFNVNSLLLKKGHSPFITFNNKQNGGFQSDEEENSNNVSDLFKNFVVPSGLLYFPDKVNFNYECDDTNNDDTNNDDTNNDDTNNDDTDDDYISEDLHDRLINLASKDNQKLSKGGSKKKRKLGNKNTKKNRK